MSILSWIKGKKKQREMRKLKPDENFEFEKEYYGDTNILEGFNFIYCNNYTDKFCNINSAYKEELSFISCVISLPTELKTLKDLEIFVNNLFAYKYNSNRAFNYNNIYIELGLKEVKLFLRGNLLFYSTICKNIYNNIFTKYIRNNLFPNEFPIETPNEFLDKMYNSINYPSKDIDILFIEDKLLCKNFKPVIGLSINPQAKNMQIRDKFGIPVDKRFITYIDTKVAFSDTKAHQRTLMTKTLREAIKARDNFTCQKCGISIFDEPHLLLEIDHIIPISKGGITTYNNLQTLCWCCNRKKGSKLLM
jgi:hypothetical protein